MVLLLSHLPFGFGQVSPPLSWLDLSCFGLSFPPPTAFPFLEQHFLSPMRQAFLPSLHDFSSPLQSRHPQLCRGVLFFFFFFLRTTCSLRLTMLCPLFTPPPLVRQARPPTSTCSLETIPCNVVFHSFRTFPIFFFDTFFADYRSPPPLLVALFHRLAEPTVFPHCFARFLPQLALQYLPEAMTFFSFLVSASITNSGPEIRSVFSG